MLFFFNTPAKYPRFLIFVKFAPLMGVPLYIIVLHTVLGTPGVAVVYSVRYQEAFQDNR